MAVIEFVNVETETAFRVACQPTTEMLRLKRGLFLLKHGQWSPAW